MPLDYAPDANITTPGLIHRLFHLVPTAFQTYTPAPGPFIEAYGTPLLNNDVIGSAIVKNAAGSSLLYAGTAGKLYQADGGTGWTDRSGAAYTASTSGTWSFAQFSDKTLAANGADKIQVATGGAFADLAAAAPTAKIVVIHENAALAFNTSGAPDGWFRSDTGDVTNWTVGASNDVDSGLLRGGSGGPITAATVYGPLALAWKRNAMYSGLFTAGAGGAADPKIRWDYVPGGTGIGCISQHGHIETEIGVIFVSDRDIMVFDGGRPRSITASKVRNYFFRFLVSRSQVFITHNEVERNIFIWYALSGTYPTRALVYNYDTGHWGELSEISSAAATYDYVRCPVRNANYTDYTAVAGTASNSGLEANIVWLSPHAGTGARLANYAASKQVTPASSTTMTTGCYGNPQQDSSWSRILQVGGSNSAPALSTVTAQVFTDSTFNPSNGFTQTGSVGPDGHADIAAQGRYLQMSFGWPAASAVHELSDLIPQATPAGRK